MDYLKIINLNKEPFSNSPDPDFFFQANDHVDCLQKIELSIRLKKGLAVITGDVGTGKTTICRQLIRKFAADDQIETHLILDPGFTDSSEFLQNVARIFKKRRPVKGATDLQIKDSIKKYLFRRGVDEGKTVVLIIDEGQKLPGQCLEILRELLNYETNEYKLLQIVLFAQKELESILENHKNFVDRISLYYFLKPLNFKETRAFIHFRLEHAADPGRRPSFFSYPALVALYLATGGYPRKIVNLCHRIILTLIIQNLSTAGWSTVRASARRTFYRGNRARKGALIATMAILCLGLLFFAGSYRTSMKSYFTGNDFGPEKVSSLAYSETELTRKNTNVDQAELSRPAKGEIPSINPYIVVKEVIQTGESSLNVLPMIKKTALDTAAVHPELLGELAIGKNETIGRMIQRVYGAFTPGKLNKIRKINPDLENPDRLSIGQVLRFPFIPSKDNSLINYYWVEIAHMDSLRAAYDYLKDYPGDAPSVVMIPSWNSIEDLKFSIVLKNYFMEKALAQEELGNLHPGLASKAVVLDEWAEGTSFCSNPVF